MSKNNFKVETAANGQTPKQDTKHSCAIYVNRTFCFYNLDDGTILKKEII